MRDIVFSYADPASPRLKRGLIRAVETATGQGALKRLYLDHCARPRQNESFWQSAVRVLALDVRFDQAALRQIPRQGPVVIVANHPYGVLDGIVVAWLAEQVRPDFRILTHSLLLHAPEARPFLLPVDFSGTPDAQRTNLESRAEARRLLDEGGCLVVFPAGGISTTPDRLGREPAVDSPWQPFTAQLIQRGKATVVPIHFAGQNSRLFQIASHLSLTLRLSLIFREVKNRIGTELLVGIGEPIPFETMAPLDRQGLIDMLRRRTYALGQAASRAAVESGPAARFAEMARSTARRLRVDRFRRDKSKSPASPHPRPR